MTEHDTNDVFGTGTPPPGGFEITRLGLSRRAVNCLLRGGYTTIDSVNQATDEDLLKIRAMGVTTVQEIRARLDGATSGDSTDGPIRLRATPPVALLDLISHMPLAEIGLANKTVSYLRHAGYHTVGDLIDVDDHTLLAIRGFGQTRLDDWTRHRDLARRILRVAQQSPAVADPDNPGDQVDQGQAQDEPTDTPRRHTNLSKRRHRDLPLTELHLPDDTLTRLADLDTRTIGDLTSWEEYDLSDALDDFPLTQTITTAMAAHGLDYRATCHTTSWLTGWNALLDYMREYGHPGVPNGTIHNDYRLGQWVMWVRQKYTAGELDAARIYALGQVDGWYWNRDQKTVVLADRYDTDVLHALTAYAEREGHTTPNRADRENGIALADAAADLRRRRDTLPVRHIAALEALPGWTWNQTDADDAVKSQARQAQLDRFFEDWKPKYDRLADYAAREGHAAPLTTHHEPDGYWLGGWVLRQRQRRHTLQPRQVELLEALPGWSWEGMQTRSDREWEAAYERLLAYVDQHDTADVPLDHVTPNGWRLGAWVRRQATEDAGYLDDTRRQRLGELPGWRWLPKQPRTITPEQRQTLDRQFDATVDLVADYVHEHGHLPVAQYKTPDGYHLGHWIVMQRRNYRLGTLPEHRRKTIENVIPGWEWDVPLGRAARRDRRRQTGIDPTGHANDTHPSEDPDNVPETPHTTTGSDPS